MRRAVTGLRALCVVGVALAAADAPARTVDLNGNGMSDIWEWMHNAYGVNPNADPDGDGFSNLQESIAATDPFNSNSYPYIPTMSSTTTNFSVTLPCALGKQYSLLSIGAIGGTNWVVETNLVARSGTNVTLTAPISSVARYFRVAISDVDTDGDGVNDWEEYQLGLDPTNPFSNGQQDANGNAMSDLAFVTNMLASQNVVTISATDTVATQPDPGENATATGQFMITRGGLPLNSINVNLESVGTGTGFGVANLDYVALPDSVSLAAGESSQTVTLLPMANTNLFAPVLAQAQLMPGAGYTIGGSQSASILIYPSATANGTGLLGQYFTNSSTTYTNGKNFNPTNFLFSRIDPQIDFTWSNGMSPNLSNGFYTVRWTGQVQPQFSETYVFDVRSDDGCMLWVNDQLLISAWRVQGATDWTNSITLQAGTRYDLRLDYLQDGNSAQAHLSWYSPSQPKEIVPNSCLYPSNTVASSGSNAPSVVTSAMNAVGFLGQPFAFTVTGANTPLGFAANGLPQGLEFNTTNGMITGVPTVAGNFQVTLTTSNSIGVGASVLNLSVLSTGSSVVQEIWTNVPGINIADIPTGAPANVTNVLGTLEGTANYGINYGERIQGYFTPPVTGNYYFWIAGSDSAQLWISDDNEQVNDVLRAWVTPTNNPTAPGQNGTSSRQWNLQPSQQSPWLALVAGQQYYIQILHKTGVGSAGNWSVGWLQDPTGTNFTAAGVTPSYLLSRYYPPLLSSSPGALFTANMLALPGVTSQGVGSATLRVNPAGTQATLNFSANNLTGVATGQAINSDPYLADPSELIFDISAARPQPNGSYTWIFQGTGPLSASDILQIVNEGKASIVIQSTAFPGGEIGGHFTLANGSQTFAPPPAPPAWTDDSTNANAAVRFLTQATFGPAAPDIAAVQSLGYSGWLANQFSMPATHALTNVMARAYSDPTDLYQSQIWFNSWWQNSITAPDQLRQRVAFALSEIFVVSENGVLENHADALSSYYDTLVDNAFGNFRALLEDVTLHPSMGMYLNMQGNTAGSIITGLHADENYAREIQQLFTIGLNREWPDGTLILDSQDNLIPTYNQNVVMGFASVFTGWNFYQTNQANGRLPSNFYPPANYTNPMVLVPSHHELGTKLLLDNVVLPKAWGAQASSSAANDAYCSQDLESALNTIFNNQNVAPFICRELIQRLVTSTPSRDYVYRVAQVFNNDGAGVRGNLQAVVQAILLDYEARSPDMISQPTFGKQREALLCVTAIARAFPAPPPTSGAYSQTTNQVITVTTTSPHLLGNGDTVQLSFTDTSGMAPPNSQSYSVTATSPTTFNITAPQISVGAYGQTNGILTAAISGNGLAVGDSVYLMFASGGAESGVFQVASVIDTTHFTATNADLVLHSGNCLMPKLSVGGYIQIGTAITIITGGPHGLNPGDNVFINFTAGPDVTGVYPVVSVLDSTHFTIASTISKTQTQDSLSIYPLVPPPMPRSGAVSVQEDTWNMGYTDSGGTSSLEQSPLRSPTVFNFYYPSFEFPGILASAGLTTPEFQLTSATSVALKMNFIEQGILGNPNNTNGFTSFAGGNGSIVVDIRPWMTTNYTQNSGIPALVGDLNTALLAGQLSTQAQAGIVSFVTATNNFTYSSPPTETQMRDRVRSVVHLIVTSPDFMIQK